MNKTFSPSWKSNFYSLFTQAPLSGGVSAADHTFPSCIADALNSSRCLSSQQIWSTPKERKCLSKSVIRKTFEGMASIMLWCSRTGPQSLTAFTSVHLQLRPVYVTCVCVSCFLSAGCSRAAVIIQGDDAGRFHWSRHSLGSL